MRTSGTRGAAEFAVECLGSLDDGELYRQNYQDFSASTLVATLDARYHADVSLLTDAALSGAADAATVGQQLGLTASLLTVEADYYENFRGQGEKYLESTSGQWYYLTVKGELYQQTSGDLSTGILVARLDPSVHTDPSQLVATMVDDNPTMASIDVALKLGNFCCHFPFRTVADSMFFLEYT